MKITRTVPRAAAVFLSLAMAACTSGYRQLASDIMKHPGAERAEYRDVTHHTYRTSFGGESVRATVYDRDKDGDADAIQITVSRRVPRPGGEGYTTSVGSCWIDFGLLETTDCHGTMTDAAEYASRLRQEVGER